jgi:hypothetical protein
MLTVVRARPIEPMMLMRKVKKGKHTQGRHVL